MNIDSTALPGNVNEVFTGDVTTATEEVDARYVHPDSKKLFGFAPCIRYIPVVGPATEAFGPKCVTSLGIVYILSKGVGRSIINYSKFPMFRKHFGISAIEYQRLSSISSMGFSIKPLTAILSDTFSFFGYTKRWYMMLSCIVGAVCTLIFALLPGQKSSASIAAGMIFIAMFCIANIDVLSEGHYSRLIKRFPKPGADLISWIWALIMIGSIIASGIVGPLADTGKPQIGLYISTALQGVCAFFFIFNWYGEKKNKEERNEDFLFLMNQLREEAQAAELESDPSFHSDDYYPKKPALADLTATGDVQSADGDLALVGIQVTDSDEHTHHKAEVAEEEPLLELPSCCCGVWEVNTEVIRRNTLVAIYGVLMTIGVIIMTVLTIVGDTYQLLYGSIAISLILCASGFLFIPVTIMKANLFGWFQLASYILIPGAMDTFYMAPPDCLPNGPNFSQTFYNTISAVIGNVAGLFGVYMFAILFSKKSYRVSFIVTISIQVLASIFDLIIVNRWNYPHMPDKAMYILGDAIVYEVSYMLSYMPMNMLISRLCPKGSESTIFAILASFSNLGASMANTIGSCLMETVWPIIGDAPCDFSNLKWLIITGHLCTPLLSLPLVFLLIPNARICDEIDPELVEDIPLLQKWLNKYWFARNAAAEEEGDESVVDRGNEPV